MSGSANTNGETQPVLAEAIEQQISELSSHYGSPQRVVIALDGWPFDPLDRTDRYGEVCMVIRRPNGKLLTAIKTYYPPECYRLLTGGVDHGEAIAAGLLREVDEETGLDVAIQRFLAVIEYRLAAPDAPPITFATFAFLLDEIGGVLEVRDPHERHAAFREIDPSELLALADHLAAAPLGFDPEIAGSWHDWGQFRAVVHRVVHAILNDKV
jgi:ADP-ribose pyrophosphatase YjhB (NUDIX family)